MTDLIFIHKGYSWYVPLALLNARRFHSGNIHFIGDLYGCWVAKLFRVKAWRMSNFSKRAECFDRIYRHFSTLDQEFERFCIKRWFILEEFMTGMGMSRCTYLDTDNLLTAKLDPFIRETESYGLTFTGYSAHVCFVNRLEALAKFCAFIEQCYLAKDMEKQFAAWRDGILSKHKNGGVSDMTLFHWFQKQHPDLIGDYDSIFHVSPFDISLGDCPGWVVDSSKFKQLSWKGPKPSAVRQDGTVVALATLHHQGRAKSILYENAKKLHLESIPSLWFLYFLEKLYNFSKRILRPIGKQDVEAIPGEKTI